MPILLLLLCLLPWFAGAQTPEAAYRAFTERPEGSRSETLRIGWSLHYRGAMPHSAFAFAQAADGRVVWNFSGAQASPDAARDVAIAACGRAAQALGAPCRLFAIDGAVTGRAAITPASNRIGPLRASPLHFLHGPGSARGVVVWSHGRAASIGGTRPDSRGSATQGWVSLLNDAGWDVFRFDRDPYDDELEPATAQLIAALPQLRQAGYQRIVLAGQSRGAWHSLLTAGRAPGLIHAVIAVAPAMHGSDGRNQNGALDDWRRLIGALPANGPRLAAVLFREDAFDPAPSARIERWEARMQQRQAPSLILSPATGPADHGAAAQLSFTQAWGLCLLRFVHEPTPPTGTLRDGCPAAR